MKWLIEEYDSYVKDLVKEVKKQGYECDVVTYYSMIQDKDYTGEGLPKGKGDFHKDDCVLFYGSINMARWLIKNRPWVPTVWYNFDAYKCSHYYPKLAEFILNDDYQFMPVGGVLKNKERLFSNWVTYWDDYNDIFVRPDSGIKSFGGQLLRRETFEKDWDLLTHMCEPHEMVVVAPPINIDNEWRFTIAEGQIIAAGQYKEKGSAEICDAVPEEAYDYCRQVLKAGYHPDPMYSIDICKTHGNRYRLLEINNFCCAGIYCSDMSKIVSEAARIAEAEHNDYALVL